MTSEERGRAQVVTSEERGRAQVVTTELRGRAHVVALEQKGRAQVVAVPVAAQSAYAKWGLLSVLPLLTPLVARMWVRMVMG